jgi:hypothetical protein
MGKQCSRPVGRGVVAATRRWWRKRLGWRTLPPSLSLALQVAEETAGALASRLPAALAQPDMVAAIGEQLRGPMDTLVAQKLQVSKREGPAEGVLLS